MQMDFMLDQLSIGDLHVSAQSTAKVAIINENQEFYLFIIY